MLALDSDVCPAPVTYTIAPLNTYTFLKRMGVSINATESLGKLAVGGGGI